MPFNIEIVFQVAPTELRLFGFIFFLLAVHHSVATSYQIQNFVIGTKKNHKPRLVVFYF